MIIILVGTLVAKDCKQFSIISHLDDEIKDIFVVDL
jgi:hypothetical protein